MKPHEETWELWVGMGPQRRHEIRWCDGQAGVAFAHHTFAMQRFRDEAEAALPRRLALASAAPDMARALLAIEWMKLPGAIVDGCPVCFSLKREGHTPDCALDAALRKAGVR